jgi:hypothetical protein
MPFVRSFLTVNNSITSNNQIVNQNVCVFAFSSEREPRAGTRMQFRIYIVDGTLATHDFDQVAHCRLHVGFKEICAGLFKLSAPLVEVFDALAEVERCSFTLLDVGNQCCAIQEIGVIRSCPISCFSKGFHHIGLVQEQMALITPLSTLLVHSHHLKAHSHLTQT